MTEARPGWETRIRADRRWPRRAGFLAIILLAGTFGYWAAPAPIARAAVAPGNIAASGRNVLIQHLEGGVIQEVLVGEGDHVKPGPLYPRSHECAGECPPSGTEQRASHCPRSPNWHRASRVCMNWLPSSRRSSMPACSALRPSRKFCASASRHSTMLRKAVAQQLAIVEDELSRKKRLVDKGLTNLFEYTQIQRNQSDLIGQAGSIASQLAANATQVIEAREQIERTKTQRVERRRRAAEPDGNRCGACGAGCSPTPVSAQCAYNARSRC